MENVNDQPEFCFYMGLSPPTFLISGEINWNEKDRIIFFSLISFWIFQIFHR